MLISYLNKRANDQHGGSHQRKDRYFCLDQQWFFTTREGVIMGPYQSRQDAVEHTQTYIQFANGAAQSVVNLLKRTAATA